MSRNGLLYAGFFIIGITIFCTGCGAAGNSAASRAVQLDSGALDESYQGVWQPAVPKQLKLSETEKQNGMQKLPVMSPAGQPLMPAVQVTPAQNTERQVDAGVKPHL